MPPALSPSPIDPRTSFSVHKSYSTPMTYLVQEDHDALSCDTQVTLLDLPPRPVNNNHLIQLESNNILVFTDQALVDSESEPSRLAEDRRETVLDPLKSDPVEYATEILPYRLGLDVEVTSEVEARDGDVYARKSRPKTTGSNGTRSAAGRVVVGAFWLWIAMGWVLLGV